MGGRGSGRPAVDFEPARDVDPWGRQPGETDKAFGAFVVYRKLGAERSIRKATEVLGRKPSFNAHMQKWSARWGWGMRAGAWDAYEDRREREAVLEASEEKAREKLIVADGMWKTAAKALLMWNRVLDHLENKAAFDKKEHLANNPKAPPPAPPTPPMSPSDVHKLADVGLKLSQLLEGKPTDIQEQRKQITIEERRKGIQQLIGNPRLRAAMRQVAVAMESEGDPDGNGHAGAAVH